MVRFLPPVITFIAAVIPMKSEMTFLAIVSVSSNIALTFVSRSYLLEANYYFGKPFNSLTFYPVGWAFQMIEVETQL